ncbi:EpsG family protein [Pseudomonas muyukensis]|uniref:EpsG family protein n=1 Tax=Pseudomonas muyukensis TaxID=2842357 RepID=A0ABX8MDG3_9PSED|nr:EpsG family protein [Pseudomonas muyukensis]QXH37109.1 EpsG family protein [Pseudomonas muyukensis]
MLFFYLPFAYSALLAAWGRRQYLLYWGLAGFLIVLCAVQDVGVTEDHGNYVDYFNLINFGDQGLFFIEPSFYVLARLSFWLTNSSLLLFFSYAILGVGLKLLLFRRATPYSWLSVTLYLSYFFFLQDFNQIRIGAATALLMWAAYLGHGREGGKAVCLALLAASLHYSAVLFLPFLCLRRAGLRTVMMLYLCCCVLLMAYALDISLVKNSVQLLLMLDNPRVDFYVNNILDGEGGEVNPLRVTLHFVLLTPLALLFPYIQRRDPFIAYSVVLHLCGVLILLMLHDVQVLAYRISDIFNHFMVFSLLAYVVLFGRLIGTTAVLAVSSFQIIYVLLILEFVQPYVSVLGGL